MFKNLTDIHISVDAPDMSVTFPGPVLVTPQLLGEVVPLLRRCQDANRVDFMIQHDGFCFRGRREDNGVDGVWFRLRKMAEEPPTLEGLPTKLPDAIYELIMAPELIAGGLILVMGATGVGKTTTSSGIIVSRLKKYGGFAYTIEDPPEMPLTGWHPKLGPEQVLRGLCAQNSLPLNASDPWGSALMGAQRSQPAGQRSMLLIGEVRDKACALALLRAASNGFLVVATVFGMDICNGLQGLINQAGSDESNYNDLASSLRLVVHQRLENRRLRVSSLMCASGTDPVANKIRSGQINQLKNEIEQQANQHFNKQKLSFSSGS